MPKPKNISELRTALLDLVWDGSDFDEAVANLKALVKKL